MKWFRQGNRKRVFYTLLLSYLVILLIPILISVIAYRKLDHMVKSDANNYNMAMLRQLSQNIDAELQEIDQMTSQIAMNSRVQKFMLAKQPLIPYDRLDIMYISQDLSSYKINSFIEDLYIYYKNSDTVIVPKARYDLDLAYSVYTNDAIPFERWYNEMLNGYHYREYIPISSAKSGNAAANSIIYLQSLPIGERDNPSATLIIIINVDKILAMLDNMGSAHNDASLYIVDESNRVIINKESLAFPISDFFEQMTQASGIIESNENGYGAVVSYVKSNVAGWKYIAVTPTTVFMRKVNYLRTLIWWTILVGLSVGLTVAYILAYRNYIPIKQITSFLSTHSEAIAAKARNEYDFIKNAMITIFDENRTMKDKLHQLLPLSISDVTENHISNKYYYPIEMETRLINGVKGGDIYQIKAVLSHLFDENLDKRHLSPKALQCFLFDMVSTINRALNEIDVEYSNIFDEDKDLLHKLPTCDTGDTMLQCISDIYTSICNYVNQHKASRNTLLKCHIEEYINEHYADGDLSLTKLAQHLGINPSYLSRFYKEQTGVNVVQYLNSVRIKHAKHLLKNEPELTVEQVAQKVGYCTANTLIKNFKKSEGITPGQYKAYEEEPKSDKGITGIL